MSLLTELTPAPGPVFYQYAAPLALETRRPPQVGGARASRPPFSASSPETRRPAARPHFPGTAGSIWLAMFLMNLSCVSCN